MLAFYYLISNSFLASLINKNSGSSKTIETIPQAEESGAYYTKHCFDIVHLDYNHNLIFSDDTNTYRTVIVGKVESIRESNKDNNHTIIFTIKNDSNIYMITL